MRYFFAVRWLFIHCLVLVASVASNADAESLPPRFQLLAEIAEQGDADAQYFLGRHLFEQADDFALAREFLTRSARQDHPQAMLLLGDLLAALANRGGAAEALSWYARAAELGLAEAQLRLGNYHLEGRGGLAQDCEQALHWYRQARDRGLELAESNTVWVLATCPDAAVRDGRAALRLAMDVVYRQGRDDANNLDNLAAAFAAVGDYRSAWEVQADAIEGLGADHPDRPVYERHLRRYEARQPWLEQPDSD